MIVLRDLFTTLPCKFYSRIAFTFLLWTPKANRVLTTSTWNPFQVLVKRYWVWSQSGQSCKYIVHFFYIRNHWRQSAFYEGEDGLILPVIWRRFLDCFIVTPRVFTFSLEYVENVRGLLLLQPQMHRNIVNPVWGQYDSNLSSLCPLGGNTKEWKMDSWYRGIEPGNLGSHARTLTTVPSATN